MRQCPGDLGLEESALVFRGNRIGARAATALLIAGALTMGLTACSDDEGDEEDIAAIRAVIDANLAADASSDVEAYLATVSDDFIENVYGVFGLDAQTFPEVAADGFLGGEPHPFTGADAKVKVDGDTATAVVADSSPDVPSLTWIEASFVKVDGKWLMDNLNPTEADDTPDDAQEIEVSLVDFAFEFDEDQIESGKPTVWKITNDGDQPHIMVVSKIPNDANLDQLLQSDDTPPGVTDISDSFIFEPGESGDVTVEKPLEPGRYVFLCFVSDPPDDFENGVPHFAKGMVADFTIE